MFERFTRDAHTVVKNAEAEARELGSPTIEAEHLLLALTRADPATAVGSALAAVGLDHDTALEALDTERERSLMAVGIAVGDFDLPTRPLAGRPRIAASTKSALERTLRVSLARADRRIESGHILLALLRAEAGTVPRALNEAGIDRAALNDRMAAALDARRPR
jgi:ATP-dependent Clp protease ATP-binding subunit ClpA